MGHHPLLRLGTALVALALLTGPAAARSRAEPRESVIPDVRQAIEVVGFSAGGREVVLRIQDANQGLLFQVRDAKKNRVLSSHPFQEDGEARAWRRLRKKHQIPEDVELSSRNPRTPQVLMTGVEGPDLVIYIMEGDKIRVYERLPLLKPRDGPTPRAFVKQAVWGPKGKHVTIVYHQQVTDVLEWEGDFVHSFKYRSYRLEGTDDAGER